MADFSAAFASFRGRRECIHHEPVVGATIVVLYTASSMRDLTEKEREDQEGWARSGRRYSPLDNEALSRYFTHLSKQTAPERQRVEGLFTEAIHAGYRPGLAVRIALET
jgi:hypothetical protein